MTCCRNDPPDDKIWLTNAKYDEMARDVALLHEARSIIAALSRVDDEDVFGFWAVREKADDFVLLYGDGVGVPQGVIKAGKARSCPTLAISPDCANPWSDGKLTLKPKGGADAEVTVNL